MFEGKEKLAAEKQKQSIQKLVDQEKTSHALRKQRMEMAQQARVLKLENINEVNTRRDEAYAAMRTLDAMVMALPMELRGKVGGFATLSRLTTDKARAGAHPEEAGKDRGSSGVLSEGFLCGQDQSHHQGWQAQHVPRRGCEVRRGADAAYMLQKAYIAMKMDAATPLPRS